MRHSRINENHVKLCMCRLFLYYKKYVIKWKWHRLCSTLNIGKSKHTYGYTYHTFRIASLKTQGAWAQRSKTMKIIYELGFCKMNMKIYIVHTTIRTIAPRFYYDKQCIEWKWMHRIRAKTNRWYVCDLLCVNKLI